LTNSHSPLENTRKEGYEDNLMRWTVCNVSHVAPTRFIIMRPQDSFTRVSGTKPGDITTSRFKPCTSYLFPHSSRTASIYTYTHTYIAYIHGEKRERQLSRSTYCRSFSQRRKIFILSFSASLSLALIRISEVNKSKIFQVK